MMNRMKVAVIGSGPIGMFSSLLLEHLNIEHASFEKFPSLRTHPSAHWVSGRSKQLLSQIPNLAQTIDSHQQSFELFRSYRYCESVLGFEFGCKNHFSPNIEERIQKTKNIFGQYPNHISQGKLLQIMYDRIEQKDRLTFGQQIESVVKSEHHDGNGNVVYSLINSKQEKVCEAEYVILANGVRSSIRNQMEIEMEGDSDLFNIINIHFKSNKLAETIQRKGKEAMLHFVYNKKMPSVLVNHSYLEGRFVLQIANYEPFLDLTKVYSAYQLVEAAFDPQDFRQFQSDLTFVHLGKWKLQALLANRMRNGNIFLVGDTAHSFTPAGGFGMNSGFQDVNHLIHAIDLIQRNPQCDREKVFQMYNDQRRSADFKYLTKSMSNYRITQKTAGKLGFTPNLIEAYSKVANNFPKPLQQLFPNSKDAIFQSIRLKFNSMLYKRATFEPELELFFDDFDSEVCRLSQRNSEIIECTKKKQLKDLWVDESVTDSQIESLFGRINEDNIQRIKSSDPSKNSKQKNLGQRIVRRDGVVCL